MAIFRYRLAPMLRLRESERDRCRQEAAEALRNEEEAAVRVHQLNNELAELRKSVERASRPGRIAIDRFAHRELYERQLKTDLRQAEEAHRAATAEVERCRQRLVDANREVQILEKHREQQLARHRAAERKLEIKQLDEQAITANASRIGAKLRQLS